MTHVPANSGLAQIFENEAQVEDHRDTEKMSAMNSNRTEASKIPSWFHHKDAAAAGEAMSARYLAQKAERPPAIDVAHPEAYEEFKRKMDDRFAQAQQLYDGASEQTQRPTLPLSDIHGRRRLYQQEQRSFVADERQRMPAARTPWLRMAGLGLTALLVGGGAGLAVVNMDMISARVSSGLNSVQASIAGLSALQAAKRAVSTETVIHKKPVAVATLDVSDVSGNLNSQIPLLLNAQAAEGEAPISLRVMGLPEASYLTAGIETTKGNWLLKPEDIAGVKLVVPQMDAPQFDVEIAAVEEKTGVLAAPVKAMTVAIANPSAPNVAATIAPANAMPDTAIITPALATPVNPEAASLITKGDGLLNSGDLASARQFYLRANELGDAKGAYGVGRTYDPKIFAALNVQGLQPEPAKAAEWYKKAIAGGVTAARTAMENLPK